MESTSISGYIVFGLGALSLLAIIQGAAILLIAKNVVRLTSIASIGGGSASLLSVGSPAPSFAAHDLRSDRIIDKEALQGDSSVFLFLTSDCPVCKGLAAAIRSGLDLSLENLIIVWRGSKAGAELYLSGVPNSATIVLGDDSIYSAFRIRGFPVAVTVGPAWTIDEIRYPRTKVDLTESLSRAGTEPAAALSELGMLSQRDSVQSI